jgi:UDP-N-acetylmuramoyl-tripeptide--D-alanyl-D-alanine ligase
MAMLDPGQAATIAHGAWVEGQPDAPLTTFAIDSRVLEPGQTFVALRTHRADGHDFIAAAAARGALAALVEKPDHSVALPQLAVSDSWQAFRSLARVWRQRFKGPVIGITGSVGKTTVKELLGSVMGSQWFRTRDNLNNTLGVPLSLLELDSRHDAGAIIEAGINMPGEMQLLADIIDPDLALVTAVGPAHLEQLGSIEGVAAEKAKLAAAVRPGGVAVIRGQLLQHAAFRQLPDNVRVHAVCLDEAEARLAGEAGAPHVTIYHYKWAENANSRGMGGLRAGAPMPAGTFRFRAGSPGMVSNLALVVHTGLHLGVPPHTLQACLDSWRPFRHRGETWRHGKATFYIDCYNANPASMADSVQRFKILFAGKPQLYVLGSMDELGEESAQWHRATARGLDLPQGSRVWLLGHGANAMREGLIAGGLKSDQITAVANPGSLQDELRAFEGAVFLKASRSSRLESLIPEGARRC